MLYHITTKPDWDAQHTQPDYLAGSLATEGFIHLSTSEQVAGVRERYYSNVPDLLLLHIDLTRLTAPLRYEPATGGVLYPHLYGPLTKEAIVDIRELI